MSGVANAKPFPARAMQSAEDLLVSAEKLEGALQVLSALADSDGWESTPPKFIRQHLDLTLDGLGDLCDGLRALAHE